MTPVLDVRGLSVVSRDGTAVLDEVSLTLREGARLGVIGESGAGKSTLALAALGVVRPGLRRTGGTVALLGQDVHALGERERRALRRTRTAWLGQDPAASLTPTMTVGRQVAEILGRDAGPDAVAARLEALGLPGDEGFRRRLPHQLSGGQQRRVALARALAARPALVVLDEPTAGLDAVSSGVVVDEVLRMRAELGFALLVISHDVELVARTCDDVAVLHGGRVAEHGRAAAVLAAPTHSHTRALVSAQPDRAAAATRPAGGPADGEVGVPVLRVDGLRAGFDAPVLADVGFSLEEGECVALVGPSGSGKSTLARCLVGLHRPDAGRIRLGSSDLGTQDLAPRASDRTSVQRGEIQLVPQDPFGSLHPRRAVGAAIARPARLLHGVSRAQARDDVGRLLELVGLDPALGSRRPSQLSGGERQRVALARALAARPRVLVCDEITSALDATVAADVLDVLGRLRAELGLAVLLVSHDLGSLPRVAHRVLVLADGSVCEHGPVPEVLHAPRHAVTAGLVAASRSLSETVAGLRGSAAVPVSTQVTTPVQ